MKKLFLAKFALLTFIATTSNAGEIAILDVERIVKESKAMVYIQKKVSKKQEDYQKEVSKKQTVLEKEQKRLESKKSVLSEAKFKKELQEFEEKVDDLKTYVDRKQNSLKKASLDAMSKVNDKIKDIISDISKERGIDVIIPAAQALYYKDTLDISEEVLKRLNDKMTKVRVRF